jgi:hypothetical protein
VSDRPRIWSARFRIRSMRASILEPLRLPAPRCSTFFFLWKRQILHQLYVLLNARKAVIITHFSQYSGAFSFWIFDQCTLGYRV